MGWSYSELLAAAAVETEAQLSEETVTVSRRAPTGDINPATLVRPASNDGEPVSAAISEEERVEIGEGGKRRVFKTFSVRAASLTFTPSRGNTVTDSSGVVWRVVFVRRLLAGAMYDRVAERMS